MVDDQLLSRASYRTARFTRVDNWVIHGQLCLSILVYLRPVIWHKEAKFVKCFGIYSAMFNLKSGH
jgi:hypothetical protein